MKKAFFYISVSVFFWVASQAHAEFSCVGDVRYKWRSLASQKSNVSPHQKPAAVPPTEAPDAADVGVSDVFWVSVEGKGATEDEAKAKLKILINDQRIKADRACRDAHENQSNCLANKYSQYSSIQGSLTFSQRKELEKKMVEDCEMAAGNCLGSAATEPVCKEIVAAAAAEDTSAAKGKEKDKGAKKK